MDFIKNAVGGDNNNQTQQGRGQGYGNQNDGGNSGFQSNQGSSNQQGEGGGFLSGITNKVNQAAGGGKESEKNEDYLDKGVDLVQEKFLGGGAQDNESAVEQAKDEQISDFIRGKYKNSTGNEIPIKDKETRLG